MVPVEQVPWVNRRFKMLWKRQPSSSRRWCCRGDRRKGQLRKVRETRFTLTTYCMCAHIKLTSCDGLVNNFIVSVYLNYSAMRWQNCTCCYNKLYHTVTSVHTDCILWCWPIAINILVMPWDILDSVLKCYNLKVIKSNASITIWYIYIYNYNVFKMNDYHLIKGEILNYIIPCNC